MNCTKVTGNMLFDERNSRVHVSVDVPFSPTPRVSWKRAGADMPPRKREESFGQELVIENIQFEDAGKYECMGINEETSTPIRRSFNLKVQCK